MDGLKRSFMMISQGVIQSDRLRLGICQLLISNIFVSVIILIISSVITLLSRGWKHFNHHRQTSSQLIINIIIILHVIMISVNTSVITIKVVPGPIVTDQLQHGASPSNCSNSGELLTDQMD